MRNDLSAGRAMMNEPEQSEKERNREIAQNERERTTDSAVRVSSWAIGAAVILGLIALGLASPWLGH
jgi:anti-sigma factor RsiW